MVTKGDFIEIDYTGIDQVSNRIFDTTSAQVAKDNNAFNEKTPYKPIIICLGEHQILTGLEEQLEGKDLNKEYTIELPPEKGFGKKNPKLIQLLSASNFKKQNLTPYPGLQVNIDGLVGIIKTVTPGRVMVDFNHPLAGHNLTYKIKILRKLEDDKEKIDALVFNYSKKFTTKLENGNLTIKAKLHDQIKKELIDKIPKLVNTVKKVTIEEE